MDRVLKVLAAAVLLVVSALLHNFYVDYAQNADRYLLSWKASDAQHALYLEAVAQRMVRTPVQMDYRDLDTTDADRHHFRAFLQDPSNRCRYMRNDRGVPSYEAFLERHDPKNWSCRVDYTPPDRAAEVEQIRQGITFEQALARVRRDEPRSTYGMVPSAQATGTRQTPDALAKSMWLGLITPIALLAVALSLLMWAVWPRKRVAVAVLETPTREPLIKMPTPSNQTALAHMLKLRFGDWYPVGEGSATEEDPLVLLEPTDYVSLEYQIANYFLSGLETQMLKAHKFRRQGADIEALTMRFRRPGQEGWEGERTFYFDITVGLDQIEQSLRRSKTKNNQEKE